MISSKSILYQVFTLILVTSCKEKCRTTASKNTKIKWEKDDFINHLPLTGLVWTETLNTTIQLDPTQCGILAVDSPKKLELFISKTHYSERIKIPTDKKGEWFHFGFFSDNQTLYIFREHQVIKRRLNITGVKLFVKTRNETMWKIQYCPTCKVSTTPTLEQPAYFVIPPANGSELILNYSFCLNCSLELLITRGNYSEKVILKNTFKENDSRRTNGWQNYAIKISPYEPIHIKIFRKVFEKSVESDYWIINLNEKLENYMENEAKNGQYLQIGIIAMILVLIAGSVIVVVLKMQKKTRRIEQPENTTDDFNSQLKLLK